MQSDSIKAITSALVKAQTELKNPDKNQQGYGYRYTDLASILDQVKPVLSKNGLTIVQTASDDGNGKVGVSTLLLHESGEFISDTLRLPIPEMKGTTATQAAGAAITYARRYSLSAMLNIASDEDTDASNKNGSSKAPVSNQPKNTTTYTGKATDKQVQLMAILLKQKGEERKNKIYQDYQVSSIKELTTKQASESIEWLNTLPPQVIH